jgi:molecular chaperone DnaK
MRNDGVVLGIDLGTSYSSAAVWRDGRVQPVLDGGEHQVPSAVYVPPRGDLVAGREAQIRGLSDPAASFTSIKRLLGRRHGDDEVRSLASGLGLHLRPAPDGTCLLQVRESELAPAQLVAAVLARLRGLAERRFGGRVERCVMTVPVDATPSYLAALHRAAALAGLEVLRWVAEPVAAALAFGLHGRPASRRILIGDFGGGTFDASVVQQEGTRLTPIACAGDPWLGGDDFDLCLADAVAGQVYRSTRVDLRREQSRWTQFVWRCESAKRQLSSRLEARVCLKDAWVEGGVYRDLDVVVDRPWIEPRWATLVERAVTVVRGLLERAGWTAAHIDELVLVGGTSLVPVVQRTLAQLFPVRLTRSEHASLAVVSGAAYVAACVSGGRDLAARPLQLVEAGSYQGG